MRLPRRLRDGPLRGLDQLPWQVGPGEPAADGASAAQPDRPARPEPVGDPGDAAAPDPQLLDPCLQGVADEAALVWAATPPGPEAVARLTQLCAGLLADLTTACSPVEPGADGGDRHPLTAAVLFEAVAAAERCLAHVTAQRDVALGVLARRRQAEADADAAAARAATARDGVGRPRAKVARSTAPTEVAARLSISTNAAAGLLDRGSAALEAHRDVGAAMATGAVSPALGTWLLDQLVALHAATEASTYERERARRTAALEEQRSQEDAQRALTGQPALSASAAAALVRADAAQADADAETAAREDAARVTSEVKDELLREVLGAAATGAGEGSTDDAPGTSADDARAQSPASPEGLGDTREKWRRQLTRSVARTDPPGFEARARAKLAARSVTRWSEEDGQACIQLRGPAEDVALIGTAMDAGAKSRQQEARAVEREAARAQGRPFDRSAVGSLDAHRVEALEQWAVAALELAGTSGVSGTWYPIARTAASRPVVSVVLPSADGPHPPGASRRARPRPPGPCGLVRSAAHPLARLERRRRRGRQRRGDRLVVSHVLRRPSGRPRRRRPPSVAHRGLTTPRRDDRGAVPWRSPVASPRVTTAGALRGLPAPPGPRPGWRR